MAQPKPRLPLHKGAEAWVAACWFSLPEGYQLLLFFWRPLAAQKKANPSKIKPSWQRTPTQPPGGVRRGRSEPGCLLHPGGLKRRTKGVRFSVSGKSNSFCQTGLFNPCPPRMGGQGHCPCLLRWSRGRRCWSRACAGCPDRRCRPCTGRSAPGRALRRFRWRCHRCR